jgi:hypothetical protein
MTTKPCRYCNGTGFRPEVAHVDHGRCWHCNKVDTSYTRDLARLPDAVTIRLAGIMVGGGRRTLRAVRRATQS